MNTEERNHIYNEVQASVKEKYNVDVSIQEINSICRAQYKIMVYGFTKGIATALPFIGTFIPVDYQYYKDTFIDANKEKQKALLEEDKKEEAIETMRDSINKYKEILAEKKKGTTSADEVIFSPAIGTIPEQVDIFKTFK